MTVRQQKHMKGALVIVTICMCSAVAVGQTVTGRSNTGGIQGPDRKAQVKDSTISVWPLRIDLEFSDPSGNGALEAKERGRLRVIITNTSRIAARGVYVKISSVKNEAALAYNDSIDVGDIPSMAVRYAFFYFTAPQRVLNSSASFRIQVIDATGLEVAEPKELPLATKRSG
jgi:hypothetical protein